MKPLYILLLTFTFILNTQAQEINHGRADHIIGDIYPTEDGYWLNEMDNGRYTEIFKISHDGSAISDTLEKLYLDIYFVFNKYAFIGEDDERSMYLFRYDEYTAPDDSLYLYKFDKDGNLIWSKAIADNSSNSFYVTSSVLIDSTIYISALRDLYDDNYDYYPNLEIRSYSTAGELKDSIIVGNAYGFEINKLEDGLLILKTETSLEGEYESFTGMKLQYCNRQLDVISEVDLGPNFVGFNAAGDVNNILVSGVEVLDDFESIKKKVVQVDLENGLINWQKEVEGFSDDYFNLDFLGTVYQYDDHFLVSYNLEGNIDSYSSSFIMKYSKDGAVEQKILDMASFEGLIAFNSTRLKGDFLHFGGFDISQKSVYGKIDLRLFNHNLDLEYDDVHIFGSSQILNIEGLESNAIQSITLLNTVGQQVETDLNPIGEQQWIYHASHGLYVIVIETAKGNYSRLVYLK